MRPDMRGHLVPLPEVLHQEPLLCKLQDIQLGIFYDLHTHAFHKELLHLESLLYVSSAADTLGSDPDQVSREILGRFQQSPSV